MPKVLQGFKDFILRGNAVDLAVGVVIGAAFNTMVQSIVKGLLTPLIGAITKVSDFSGLAFEINGSRFTYGDSINAIISFLLISIVIYFFVIVPMNALRGLRPKPSTTKICPQCLSDIPAKAKRCAFCGQLTK